MCIELILGAQKCSVVNKRVYREEIKEKKKVENVVEKGEQVAEKG